MIETLENTLQLTVLGVCSVWCFVLAWRLKERGWTLLALFYAAIVLGDLYWVLYLLFYHTTLQLSYVSGFAWYAAYLFLLILLRYVQGEKTLPNKHPLLWIVPLFVIGMCAYFMQFGDYLGNIVTALLMGLLLWNSLGGLLAQPEAGATDEEVVLDRNRKRFYVAVLAFCLIEYALWTSSCIWFEETIANPYYWIDFLFTISMVAFLPLLGKVLKT